MFLAKILEGEKDQLNQEKYYSFTSPDSKNSLVFLFDKDKKLTGGILKPNYKLSLKSLLRLMVLFNERRHGALPCCKKVVIGDNICATLDFKRNYVHLFRCGVEFRSDFATLLPFCENDIAALRMKDKEKLKKICSKIKRTVAKNMVEDLCISLETATFLQALDVFKGSIIASYSKFEVEAVLVTYGALLKGILPLEEVTE